METRRRLISLHVLLFAAVLLLSACANLLPRGPLDDVASLLAYNQRLTRLSTDQQRQEFAAAQQAFANEPSEMNRLRLALVLCLPNANWRDDARLTKLLEESASLNGEEGSPMRQLALLLYQEVSERRQEDQRLETALRDERRRHETQLREEKRHAEELQGKLDSLMEIEREFSRRQRQKAPPR
ncbi:MAG TPA: hypothetical protein VMB75_03800 [Rhodocyclaceae bacterium]|nr:hypothetical protein [Rhodocyclaceae bacterium]